MKEPHPLLTEIRGRVGVITLNRPGQLNALYERRELHARFASEDAHEGMNAFLSKRTPVFQHH